MNFKLNIQLFGNAVIPYNEGRNGKRSIDGLWEQEFNVAKALTAAIGCEFGSVLNIQDAGQKEQGKVYLDKNNGKLYKCLNTTTSVSNTTENFTLFNLQQSSDRLDNLFEIEMISSNTFHDTGLSNVTLREFLFYGDFENVISIIPTDSTYPVSEYCAIHPNKKSIFSGYIKTEHATGTHSLMIVRIKG